MSDLLHLCNQRTQFQLEILWKTNATDGTWLSLEILQTAFTTAVAGTLVEIVGFVVVVVVGFFILFFVFLEGEDFGGSSDDSLPACALKVFFFFFFSVDQLPHSISIPLFRPISTQSGSGS